MRRGLLGWNPEEVPQDALDARIARCQEGMRADGLDALLIYTNFPRPAAVSYLTHFIPYWSQGLLLLRPEGGTMLLVSLSKRVGGWIDETSYLGEIVCTPRLGAETANQILTAGATPKKIGVVEFAKLPGGIARPLIEGLPGAKVEDATALFRKVRQPADAAEIAMTRRAAEIADISMKEALAKTPRDTAALIGAIELTARLMGAEEVQTKIAPDINADTRLRHMEGIAPLADRYFVQSSVAYKGHWVRLGRTIADDAVEPATDGVIDSLAALGAGAENKTALAKVHVSSWTIEGCTGSPPLATLQSDGSGDGPAAGSIVVVNARLEGENGAPCLISEPVLLARDPGDAAIPLTRQNG